MKLLVPALLLLPLAYLATAEVVRSFTGICDNFFAKGTPPIGPSGSQYRNICQKLTGGYEFATLYDTRRKIPVYSAYKFETKGSCQRKSTWSIEPQLDDQNGGASMASESTVRQDLRGKRQALNGDYVGTDYDKGHLVPVRHRTSQSCADATFTLTNAAPQYYTFNRGQWKVMEGKVSAELSDKCLNRGYHAYVVTGVVAGQTTIGEKVNVPSYFWSAYCCVDNNNRPKLSGAYYGYNNFTNKVTEVPIADLDAMLGRDYAHVGFQVFSDRCLVLNRSPVRYRQIPNRPGKIGKVGRREKRRRGQWS